MRTLAIALLLVLPLAGCSDDNDAPPKTTVPDSIQDVEVTDDTGAIRGIVTDETIKPLGGVKVSVSGLAEAKTTAADGGFAFGGLAPGDYFITAELAGFQTAQSSASVVAGDQDPPLVKILLTVDSATGPAWELQNWKAFLQCGFGAGGRSVNPCAASGSDNVHGFSFGRNVLPDFAQVEAVWSGTQPLGNELSLGYLDEGSLPPANWKNDVGVSPLVVPATRDELLEAVGEEANGLTVRVFPGNENPTVVTNQQYDVYMSYFYNMVPREGWSFAVDGPCDPPESCK